MANISAVNLAIAGYKAGWRADDLIVAVATALSFSGGNTTHAGGLWGLPGASSSATAEEQAASAHAVWSASGWGPFPTHRSRGYLLAMPTATAAVAAAPLKDIIDNPGDFARGFTEGFKGSIADVAQNLPGEDLVATLKSAIAPIYKAGAWMGNQRNWIRVAYVLFGGAIIVGSLVTIAGPSALGQIAGNVAKPLTRALKAGKK